MTTDLVTSTLDTGPGSLRQVLSTAAPGDTIDFAVTLPGTVIVLASPLTISTSVTVDGSFGASTMELSGGGVTTILQVTAGTVALENLALEFGGTSAATTTIPAPPTLAASAVLQTGGALTLNHLLIKYNFFNIAANVAFGPSGQQATNGGDAATIAVTAGSPGGDAAPLLVNGTTIRQEKVASITYWHVELADHAVVIAEGLGAESYLDTGNRQAFANAPRTLARHPRMPSAWATWACAPLVLGGSALAVVKGRIREGSASF